MPEIIERETTSTPSTPVVVQDGGGAGAALAIILGLLIIGAIVFFAVLGGGRWLSGATGGGTNVQVQQPAHQPNQQPAINIEKPNVTINNPQNPPASGTSTTR